LTGADQMLENPLVAGGLILVLLAVVAVMGRRAFQEL
jgi:hypothetical protein